MSMYRYDMNKQINVNEYAQVGKIVAYDTFAKLGVKCQIVEVGEKNNYGFTQVKVKVLDTAGLTEEMIQKIESRFRAMTEFDIR